MKLQKHWKENPNRTREEEVPVQGILFDHQDNSVKIISNNTKIGIIIALTTEEAKAIAVAIQTMMDIYNK